jgi:hypothetical protein
MEDLELNDQNSLEHSLEVYLEHADELALNVVDMWAKTLDAEDKAFFAQEVKNIMHKCSEYRIAKSVADSRRHSNMLSPAEAQAEQEARMALAMACKALDDKWMERMTSPIACGCDASGKPAIIPQATTVRS